MLDKTYNELISIPSFEERFEYLRLDGSVGERTFGSYRYLNQGFYTSREWKKVRDLVIIRDEGRDLAFEGREIHGRIIVHHINPITEESFMRNDPSILDPDNLVCVSHDTHEAIHYGDASLLMKDPVVRRPNDTCPWKEATWPSNR